MKKNYIVIAIIAGVTALAYSPVLFNFFCGDDFVHLAWLSKAISNPAMLLHNFNHNWLDIPTCRFYRPLISVFMYLDYLIWRTNGFGFHLTNVLFHIANSILVFAISVQLLELAGAKKAVSDGACKSMPFPPIAGLLFALYPIHGEAVSWITGRVDDIVTTFYLLAVWLYIEWRLKRTNTALGFSLLSMTLALTSKEMAVTLPPLLMGLEVFLPQDESRQTSLIEKIKKSVPITLPFWILLAIYFVVRRIALGTFVGGYDDSLFFIANIREFLSGWRQGLTMLAQPANQLIVGSHNIGLIAWDIGGIFALIGMFRATTKAESKRLFPFLLLWIVLALAPVYKIFAIGIDLQGSRLAYLVTAPLSMLLAWGLAEGAALFQSPKGFPAKQVFSAAAIVFLSGAFFLQYKNNDSWRNAGLEMNAMRSSLAKIYEGIDGDPQTLLLGIPDQQKGAYAGRNAVPEMLQKPQFPRNLQSCFAFNWDQPILPFGYLRKSVAENPTQTNVFLWDRKNKNWIKLAEEALNKSDTSIQNQSAEQTIFDTKTMQEHLTTDQTREQQTINCDNVNYGKNDFVFIDTAQNLASEMRDKASAPVLTFSNELSQTTGAPINIEGHQFSIGDRHGFIFSMRACPYWTFAEKPSKLEIKLPASIVVKSMSVLNDKEVMPQITFSNSGFLGSKGFTHLSQKDQTTTLTCASNDVIGAKTFALEIIRPNSFLGTNDQNAPEYSRMQQRLIKGADKTGIITLERKDFAPDSIYQARLFALDANGELVGVAGDHINIRIEPD